MPGTSAARLRNEEAISRGEIPLRESGAFRQTVLDAIGAGGRLSAYFGLPIHGGTVRIFAVVADDAGGDLLVCSTDVHEAYESLTPDCPEAQGFERELWEQHGIVPRGHPWLKPVRFEAAARGEESGAPRCGVTKYFAVEGEEIHEVAVGPVHAGVIEPGHFRFQCHGEEVLHLEISLGYQHRGIESALVGGPGKLTVQFMETLAGDTTIGHSMAYCQAVEALSECHVPPRGLALRGIALELERLANHVGDLGALAGDVGFLPTSSYCGRIRGDVLNMTALICGSRFGRGLVRPGGTAFDTGTDLVERLRWAAVAVAKDIRVADALLWDSPSAMARFEGTGLVPADACEEIGLVGPAARACGVDRDVRKDHPFGIYRFTHIPTCTWSAGDVFGRAHIRSIEIQRSLAFVCEQLDALPVGDAKASSPPTLPPNQFAVSMVEGWRGEICHVAVTGEDGRLARYKVVDPAFHNWFGLALALRGQQISDFPLCNKSFNLSYCGHDL